MRSAWKGPEWRAQFVQNRSFLDFTALSSLNSHWAFWEVWGASFVSYFGVLCPWRALTRHQPVPALGLPPRDTLTAGSQSWVAPVSGLCPPPALRWPWRGPPALEHEQSHVDTHLFFSSSPASPLERQQKQVNRGTCQSHARYVDGKREQAKEGGLLRAEMERDRERQAIRDPSVS